jgi:spectinomycin phosphotransferase
MRTPPEDLTEEQVAATVSRHWSITAARIRYAPLGFGSHHWLLSDVVGGRWFLTGDALSDDPLSSVNQRLDELEAALTTTHALRHRCGLPFVTAPVPGAEQGLLTTTGLIALALYPYQDSLTDVALEPQQILAMVTALHDATEAVRAAAPVEDFSISGRPSLSAALAGINGGLGPYATAFLDLVVAHKRPIEAALHRHDALAAGLDADRDTWVITHGEPKANNTILTATGPVLVDWDTVALAPPGRDVWMTGLVGAYTKATGRTVSSDALEYYRLHWDLKDLCGYARWFTRPHRRTADTDLAWKECVRICGRLAT